MYRYRYLNPTPSSAFVSLSKLDSGSLSQWLWSAVKKSLGTKSSCVNDVACCKIELVFHAQNYETVEKICVIALDIFAIFFDCSNMLLVLAKQMFINTIPNQHSVQTLVQDELVYRALSIWSIESMLFSSFNSRTSMVCRSYEADGAWWLDAITNSTPYRCKLISIM